MSGWSSATSGVVCDVLRTMNYPNLALPQSIRPLDVEAELAGPVFTAAAYRKDHHRAIVQTNNARAQVR